MARKPGRMYSKISGPAYTRREYMGGVPAPRITHFDYGNKSRQFPIGVTLIAEEGCQIRHTALEAARISSNRYLSKILGTTNYRMKIRTYPHHVLRENKQATGAGADRVSQGMRKAFGKPVGTAARGSVGQKLITVYVEEQNIETAKKALRKASMKLPTPCRILPEKLN